MIFCQSCGRSNPDGNRFCNECGARLGRPVPCPVCGFENLSTSRFCGSCGEKLGGEPGSAQPNIPPEDAEEPAPTPPPVVPLPPTPFLAEAPELPEPEPMPPLSMEMPAE